MSLRQCHPTIERQVAPPLEVFGSIRLLGTVWSPEQQQDTLEATLIPLILFNSEATVSRQLDLQTGGRPLKHLILDDHVSRGKATVRRTLRVVCEFVYCFQLCFILSCIMVSYALILFGPFILSCRIQQLKGAEIKVRKIKSYAITRRGSIHRQINKDPF